MIWKTNTGWIFLFWILGATPLHASTSLKKTSSKQINRPNYNHTKHHNNAQGFALPHHTKTTKSKRRSDPNRLEWGAVPVFAGSSDIGVGFGAAANLAKFKPGYFPYQWRLQLFSLTTVNKGIEGGIESPFHYYAVIVDLPKLAGGLVRIDFQARFTRFFNSGYYGIGNASQAPPVWERFDPIEQPKEYTQARRRYLFDHTYPNLRFNSRTTLTRALSLFLGGEFSYNWIRLFRGSKLEEDVNFAKTSTRQDPASLAIREMMAGVTPHGNLVLKAGLLWDTRDHEAAPNKGMFHTIALRGSPGFVFAPGITPRAYGGLTMHSRFFFTLWKDHLVLASRLLTDILFGQVPFYEMANFGGLIDREGTGGEYSIRGLAARRYHGKIKVLGNIELRAKYYSFQAGSSRFTIGMVTFVDAGRVWTDYKAIPKLDGTGMGMHWGVGTGLRLQWGESFVIRADFAKSFEANTRPVGVYVGVNQIF